MSAWNQRAMTVALMFALACGGSVATETIPDADGEPGVLLDAPGELAAGDMQIGSAYSDPYEFQVNAGDELEIEVVAEDFDPILEVMPPGKAHWSMTTGRVIEPGHASSWWPASRGL